MLKVGDNSWVEVYEADEYLEDKFGADEWNDTSFQGPMKEQLLITAWRWIYNYPYYNISKDCIKQNVKDAQCELAWWYYKYGLTHQDRMALQADGIDSFNLKGWSEKHLKENTDLPQIVKEMLQSELVYQGGYYPKVDRELQT